MAKERLKRLASSSNVPGFLAFALPALILFIGFQTAGVFPFGDRHILTIDLFHQYAPFLAEYRRKLLSFWTLQFSWNGGLGIDFYSLFAYYLSSPLNLLIVLFPESQLSNFVLFSVVLKTGLAGYTGYFYLRRGRAHTPWVSVVFAMGYALSSFTLAYFWNIMWLDVIVLLPILAYTALLLVREERIAPYVITLAVTLFVNYYVAFFAALFIALYFLVLLVENVPFKRWKDQLAKLVLFAGASTLSAALSAVLILPVYLKLQTTSASGDAWPEELKFTFSPLDLTARMMYATEPAVRSGLPNIYAGVLVLLFIPVYFLARKISMRAKLANAALLAVLVLSLSVNSLNFFWHGMHYPNQLPHRFAFVVVFLLVVMAADAFRAYRETGGTIVIKSAVGLGFLAVLLNRLDGELVSGRTMFITILLMVIYTAFVTVLVKRSKPGQSAALGDDVAGASDRATVRVGANRELVELQGVESAATTVENAERHSAAHKRGKRKPAFFAKVGSVQGARVLAVALISVVSLEFLVSTALGIEDVRDGQVFGDIDGYAAGEFPRQVREALKQIESDNEGENVRSEFIRYKTYNDPFLYGYNGVTVFTSTFAKQQMQMMRDLGLSTNGINSYSLNPTKPLDSFFGVKYLMDREKDRPKTVDYQTYYEGSELKVYENPNALPQAFFVKSSAADWNSEKAGALENQSAMYRAAFGVDGLFDIVEPDFSSSSGTVETRGVNELGQEVHVSPQKDEAGRIDVSVVAHENGQYYLAYRQGSTYPETVYGYKSVDSDERYIANTRKDGLIDLGYLEQGEVGRAQLKTPPDKAGTVNVQVGRLNEQAFETAISTARATDVEIVKRGKRSLEMNVNATEPGYVLVTSIWDPGWSAKVNGAAVEVKPFSDSLMLIPVEPGQNAISMKFRPAGIIAGVITTLVALVLLWLLIVSERRGRARRAEKLAHAAAAAESTEGAEAQPLDGESDGDAESTEGAEAQPLDGESDGDAEPTEEAETDRNDPVDGEES